METITSSFVALHKRDVAEISLIQGGYLLVIKSNS